MKRFWIGFICLAGLVTAGCHQEAADSSLPPAPLSADDDHDHGGGEGHDREGPHHGTLVEWNAGKYQLELVVDQDKKEVTVYVLGEDAKTAVPIATETLVVSIQDPALILDLKAVPLDGEPSGKSSRFVGTHDEFAKERQLAGTISGEFQGTPYTGDFQQKPHQ